MLVCGYWLVDNTLPKVFVWFLVFSLRTHTHNTKKTGNFKLNLKLCLGFLSQDLSFRPSGGGNQHLPTKQPLSSLGHHGRGLIGCTLQRGPESHPLNASFPSWKPAMVFVASSCSLPFGPQLSVYQPASILCWAFRGAFCCDGIVEGTLQKC